ncbi:MAG: PKD domain-containing protein [Gemmatimonadales bacterium]|nr:PKD domain-containing protein [Gemmatimonadales bacterium]
MTFAAPGSYNVSLEVTDDAGAANAVTRSVTVSPAPSTPPTADFSFSCSGLTCTFTDRSTDPDGQIAAGSWAFGDGGTSAAPSPSRTYAKAGTYTVVLTLAYSGGTDQHSATVTASAPASSIVLTVTGRTDATHLHATLRWTGASGTRVAVYRNGKLWASTANDGCGSTPSIVPARPAIPTRCAKWALPFARTRRQ